MQPAVQPDSRDHVFNAALRRDFKGLETDDEGRDQLTCFRRSNRQRDDLVDCYLRRARAAPEVTDLRRLWPLLQSKLRFFIGAENAHLGRIGWRYAFAG